MRRHGLTIAAVAVWLGMMVLQARRQMAPPAIGLEDLPSPPPVAAVDEQWFGVYQAGRKIGHTHRTTTRTPDGWRYVDESRFALALMGTPQALTTSMVADVDTESTVHRVRFSLVSPAATFAATGESDGRRLDLRYATGGRVQATGVPPDGARQLPASLRPRLVAGRPAPGPRWRRG